MNTQRGEVTLELGGKQYLLRPSFEALAEIEGALDKGIVPIVRQFMLGNYGIGDVYAVVAAGIKAGDGRPPRNLGQLLVDRGIAKVAQDLAPFLNRGIAGDQPEGEAEAPTEDQTSSPGGA